MAVWKAEIWPWIAFASIICCVYGTYSPEMETQIRSETLLSTSYDAESRPSPQTLVKVGLNLLAIDDLNLKGQKLTMAGWLTVEWEDSRLTWNKTARDDVQYIFSKPANIWKPELIVDNSMENIEVIKDTKLKLRVKYDGTVDWEPPLLFKTHCEVDITFYPYDWQVCGVEIVSWGYSLEEVSLEHLNTEVNLEDFVTHGEWVIEHSTLEAKNLTEHHADGTVTVYPQLNYVVHLKRRTEFYNLNVMMPIILTSLMVGLVFIVPVNSGEKLSYVLTVFLALAVLLTIVSDTLPPTSITTSILGLYLGIVLVSAGLGVLLTVLILILFHKSGSPRNSFVILALTRFAARCICWHYPQSKVTAFEKMDSTSNGKIAPVTSVSTSDISKSQYDVINETQSSEISCENNGPIDDMTWERVAMIIDRFCFFVFFSINVLMNVTFVVVLGSGDTSTH